MGSNFEKRLHKAICDCYDLPELEQMVRFGLEQRLDELTKEAGLREIVFALIEWAARDGRVGELCSAATQFKIERHAQVPELLALRAECEPGMPPDGLWKAVGEFHTRFQTRKDLFRFLNACKELHDVLHEVQGYHAQLMAAVAALTAQPGGGLAGDAKLALEGWVATASESVRDSEFPEAPPAWIARFAAAYGDITGPDPGKAARAVERLTNLPAKELARLNDRLIDYARRLQPEQLISLLDAVRAALEARKTNALIHAHNLCQNVANALLEANGLKEVSKDDLADWGETSGWLATLASSRPTDFRVARTFEAARRFETAEEQTAATQAFTTLIERFEDLFKKTDEALLKLTNQLPIAALTLEAALADFR